MMPAEMMPFARNLAVAHAKDHCAAPDTSASGTVQTAAGLLAGSTRYRSDARSIAERHGVARAMRRVMLLACALSLAACSALGGKQTPFAIHAPAVPAFATPTAPPVEWQLQVMLPQASSALDSPRIAVMPSPGVLEVYPAVRWRDPAPRLLRSLVVQAFDASGRITGVSGAHAGLSADYALAIELHDFQAEVRADGTHAAIRLQAKLFDLRANRIVATHAFEATSPAAGNDAASAVTAFDAALAQLLPALVDWTIEAGSKAHAARSS